MYKDELSGVYNRTYLEEQQKAAAAELVLKRIPFSVVMVDIDHFKEINDTHGHLKGDDIITAFGTFLQDELRKSDAVIRYGGDEFVCFMPNTTRRDAEAIYRRILKKCKERTFSGINISLSVGVASYPLDANDFDRLLGIADQVLYDAKQSGRGRLGTLRKRRIELPIPVFLNRRDEQDLLKHFLADSKAGFGVVVIKGNVGIGKTRLTKEILSTIKGREIIWSDCLFLADTIAYYPIRELIKYRIQRLGTKTFDDIPPVYKLEIGKLVPEIGVEIAEKGVSFVQDKYRLYEGIKKVIEFGDRPKVVVIDNIQWIDQESIDVIRYLIRALDQYAIIFVFIYRIEEETEFLKNLFLSISQEVDVKEICLNALAPVDIERGLQAVIGEEPEHALIGFVVRESGGIPYFVEEIMRGLYDKRFLIVRENAWAFTEPDKEIVPKSLEDITLRKYNSLSKEARSVLDVASVLGQFDVQILMSMTGYNEGEIVGFINDISRLGLVKYTQNRFEFAEEISRNALYKRNLEGIKGMTLHRQIAERIEEMYTNDEKQVLEALAYHYYQGKVIEKGVYYSMEAGQVASDKYANKNAVQYYTWALSLLKSEKTNERVEQKVDCLYKRAHVLNTIGENNAALRDLDEGLDIVHTIDDKEREISLLQIKARVYEYTARYTDVITTAEQCRALCIETGNKGGHASALHSIGYGYLKLGDYDKARAFGDEALKINRELQNRRGEASMLNFIGIIYRTVGKYQESLDYYENSLQIVQAEDYKLGITACLLNTGLVYRILGQYTKALSRYEQALNAAEQIGDIHSAAMTAYNLGNLYAEIGESQKALDNLENSLRIRREIGYKTGEIVNQGIIGVVYGNLGQYDRALQFLKDALSVAREMDDRYNLLFVVDSMGMIYLDIGDFERAREQFDEVATILEELPDTSQVCFNFLHRGMLHMYLDDTEKAAEYIKKAREIAESIGSHIVMRDVLSVLCELHLQDNNGSAFETVLKKLDALPEEVRTKPHRASMNLLLGRYYAFKKDFSRSERHFEKASLIYADLKQPLNIGKTYYYRGQMEKIRTQDVTCFAKFYRKAMDIFASIGAWIWKEKAEYALKV